jgi:hypothetical protein
MPAMNGNAAPTANPSSGKQVLMSPFSGPSGSPLDAKVAAYYDNLPGGTAWSAPVEDTSNLSTGALSTGIGFGINDFDGFADNQPGRVMPDPNFNDDYTPGLTAITAAGPVSATASVLTAIGGGKCTAADVAYDGIATPVPYTAGFQLLAFGGGGSRDAGAGPVFTGFGLKSVTATGAVAVGAAVETGFVNRTSYALNAGKTVFGSATDASPALA